MIERLRQLLGGDAVWEIGADGEVARALGTAHAVAASPATEEQCAAVLRVAALSGAAVVPWGAGQHQRLGNLPARAEVVVVVTTEMAGIVDYDVADQTMVVRAGTRLNEVLARARDEGQQLPLDPPGLHRATVGGVVAAGVSGPLRTGYGRPRDHVLGCRAAHPDGTCTKSGGRLVKNVTGFDLHRLYHGSLGTLGVVTELSLRLAPLPARDVTRCLVFSDLDELDGFLLALRRSGLDVAALSLIDAPALDRACPGVVVTEGEGEFVVGIRLHGTGRGVSDSVERIASLLDASRDVRSIDLDDRSADVLWSALRDVHSRLDAGGSGSVIQGTLLPFRNGRSVVGGIVESIFAIAAGVDLVPHVVCEPLLGVVRVGVPGEPSDELVAGLARLIPEGGPGGWVVESAPLRWRRQHDVFLGRVQAPALVGRVKCALDPHRVLAPGRFAPGGVT